MAGSHEAQTGQRTGLEARPKGIVGDLEQRPKRHRLRVVDQYLNAYMDLAVKLNAEWIVVHAGYHYTIHKTLRMEASLDR